MKCDFVAGSSEARLTQPPAVFKLPSLSPESVSFEVNRSIYSLSFSMTTVIDLLHNWRPFNILISASMINLVLK